jgi:hypothetical protein
MYFKPATTTEEFSVAGSNKLVILLTALITLVIGLAPNTIAGMFSF